MPAWKVADYYGTDRILLPLLGTLWPGAANADTTPRPGVGTPAIGRA